MKHKSKETVIAILFIFPSLLGIVVFYIVPYIICLIKSLYAGQEFVGLKNYIQLFSNNTFLLALKNTAIFTTAAMTALTATFFQSIWNPGRKANRPGRNGTQAISAFRSSTTPP